MTTVEIPGTFYAEMEDGRVKRFVFMPSASDAGYFGPAAIIEDGGALDVENSEGAFWRAVQIALAADVPIVWEE